MTSFIKKIMMTAALGLALVTPTLAADAPSCPNGAFAEQRDAFEKNDMKVTQLNADQIASMLAKLGSPPNSEGDFDAFLVENAQLGAVFIVQKGCTTDRLGPSSIDSVYSILGIVKARGERVD